MSAPVVLYFNVDVTGTSLVSVVPPNDITIPPAYLSVLVDKSLFFPSGISYNINTDSSGLITSITSLPNSTTINTEHILDRLQGNTIKWDGSGVAPSGVINLGVQIDTSFNKSIPYSPLGANNILSMTSLGKHIMYIIARLARLTPPTSLTGVTERIVQSDNDINMTFTSVIASTFSSQGVLDAIIDILLRADGPIFNTTPGSHILPVTNGMRDIIIMLNISSVSLTVKQPAGVISNYMIGGIPIQVRLTDILQ